MCKKRVFNKKMDLLDKINFAQLHSREEKEFLAVLSSEVPENGTIVEIGTGRGGTSTILHIFSKNNVMIYSYDILPCLEARKRLKGTNVKIIQKLSLEAAQEWQENNRLIDLLFIDGNHAFHGIFTDFNSWIKWVKPGGKIAIHDYDPLEDGGVYHLGVRIFGDSILRLNILENPKRVFSILAGDVKYPQQSYIKFEEGLKSLKNIGEEIIKAREQYKNVDLPNIQVNKLIFCYLIDYLLKNDYEKLVSLITDKPTFFHWEEAINMLDYSRGNRYFPDNLDDLSYLKDEFELSRFVASEQAKLFMLSKISLLVTDKKIGIFSRNLIAGSKKLKRRLKNLFIKYSKGK